MNVLQKSGKFTLTAHAKERIRIRVGIDSLEAQVAWANETIAKATTVTPQGNKTVYKTDTHEIVCGQLKVITVTEITTEKSYINRLSGAVTSEVRKMLVPHERLLRKAEIQVAEHTLNYLKAKNPKIKSAINSRLTEAIDEKQRIKDEVYAMRKAAEQYGVEV